jgi:hypothetical protein
MDAGVPFNVTDYRDTVHLNGVGGRKFVDQLVAYTGKDRFLSQIVAQAARAPHERSLATSTMSRM